MARLRVRLRPDVIELDLELTYEAAVLLMLALRVILGNVAAG